MIDAWRGVASPIALLALFVLVIRGLPELARPATPPDNCERVSPSNVPALERCLALRPDDIELMIDLADSYERTGQAARAVAVYRRALTIDPKDADLHRRLDALAGVHAGGAAS